MTMIKTTLRSAYLAGPMRGIPDYNFPAFRHATALLRQTGWVIFSPAERDEQDPDIDHEKNVAGWTGERGLDYFMAHDLKAVCEHDAVFCLPGWEQSQGARLETVTAVEIGHPVFDVVSTSSGDGYYLKYVDPDYILEVFAARGKVEMPEDDVAERVRAGGLPPLEVQEGVIAGARALLEREHVLSGDCWCEPEVESFAPDQRVAEQETLRAEPFDAYDVRAVLDFIDGKRGVESALPTGSEARKAVPLVRGVVDYFPAALAEVARVSKAGNDKHNPGQDMHHARGKSTDHADCLLRHLVDRGKVDPETGQRHSAQVAWRALALLQEELESAGEAPLPRGARLP